MAPVHYKAQMKDVAPIAMVSRLVVLLEAYLVVQASNAQLPRQAMMAAVIQTLCGNPIAQHKTPPRFQQVVARHATLALQKSCSTVNGGASSVPVA
jgi:hypothetical protein